MEKTVECVNSDVYFQTDKIRTECSEVVNIREKKKINYLFLYGKTLCIFFVFCMGLIYFPNNYSSVKAVNTERKSCIYGKKFHWQK